MKKHFLFFSIIFMAIIYGSFLATDITTGFSSSRYSAAVRYLCILICVILVFTAGKDSNNPKDFLLVKLAFFFTACADFMMSMICKFPSLEFGFCVNLEPYRFACGVALFLIVQILYIIRHKPNFKWTIREVITLVFVFGVMIDKMLEDINHISDKGGGAMNYAILAVLLVYAIVLCVSTWMAIGTLWRGYFPKTTAWFIAIGMVLFFLCDNSLGRFEVFKETVPLKEQSSFIKYENNFKYVQADITNDTITVTTDPDKLDQMTIPFTLKTICGVLVWFFYLPAQVLLMLSAFNLTYLSSIFGLIKPPKRIAKLYQHKKAR